MESSPISCCVLDSVLLTSTANMAIERGQWPLDRMQGSSVCTLPGCEDYVYCDPHTGVVSWRENCGVFLVRVDIGWTENGCQRKYIHSGYWERLSSEK